MKYQKTQHKLVEKDLRIKTLRKEVLMFWSVLLCLVLGFIVYNITESAKHPRQTNEVVVTQPPDIAWYRDAKSSRPLASQPIVVEKINADASNPIIKVDASQILRGMNSFTKQEIQPMNKEQLASEKQAMQERKEAMQMSLANNALTPQNNGTNISGGGGASNNSNSSLGGSATDDASGLPKDDQNMTAEKRKFMAANGSSKQSDILNAAVNEPVAEYVLSWGTLLPAKLDKQINSDLPGQIYGHFTRDIYDSRTHSVLLIPAGSQLVGNYDSAIAYGQERLLVSWQRVNFPNGQWLNLKGMGGADPVGAGFGDMVDNHYWRIFGATFLTSVLAAGAQLSQPQQSNALQSPSVGQTIGQSVGTQIAQTGAMLMQKNINIQPTIIIRAGFDFNVEVNKDIIFPGAYRGNPNK